MNQLQSSRVDFNAKCDNSSRLHIIVLPVGSTDEDFLNKIPAELSKVPLPNQSQLNARFVLQTQPLLSDWSDVQYYRRPIGLICISLADSSSNLTGIVPQYEKIKRRMETSVIDSRCIVFSQETLTLPPDCIRPDIMVIQYLEDVESVHCEALTALIGEFTQALYSVIVRNSIEMASEKYTPQLLYSPYERSKSGLDDGKIGRKRVLARHKKHLGDLFLIIGKPEKAIDAYDESIKSLLSLGDSLWIGAAFEGQACAISRLMKLEEVETISISKSDKLRSSQESLNSISSEPEMRSPENLIRLFRNAINHMEKVREASLIMLECILKFIRLTIELDCKRESSSILNSEVFYSYDDLNPVEKLQFFCTIAILYEQMGMHRKYSYFLRQAALESVHEKMLSRAYTISSSLLCSIIEMYGVVPGTKSAFGWPRLQKIVLNDLISSSDKLANSDIVVKYGMCLLQSFYVYLDYDDQLRILNLIFKNNTRLGDHVIEVPNVPICKQVVIKPLGKSLQPRVTKQSSSIFIFNPNDDKDIDQKISWVCNEFGEVSVKLENPLLHSLQLFDIRCIVEGGPAECYPSTITIHPKQTVDIMLAIKPLQPGKLSLTGVKLQLCGVPSIFKVTCSREISVCKAMPLLIVKSDIPSTLILNEGEHTTLCYKLTNNSSYPIEHLDVIDNCSRRYVFDYSDIPLPILPGAVIYFDVKVCTLIINEKREECLGIQQSQQSRHGTIYENSSEDDSEEDTQIIRYSKSSKVENAFIKEKFSVCFQYYDKEKEFFRQTHVEFLTQINLLYQLTNYSIVQHPCDSSKCQWHLTLISLCSQRMELKIAEKIHFVDPGKVLISAVDIDREMSSDVLHTCQYRVKNAELINPFCRCISWSIGKKKGKFDIIESVSGNTDLANAFKEELILSCGVVGFEFEEYNRYKTKIGTAIYLNTTVTNVSNHAVESILIFVRTFEEGLAAFRTIVEIPFIGTRDCTIDNLCSDTSVSHEFTFLPMTCGNFSVEVSACLMPKVGSLQSCSVQYDCKKDLFKVNDHENKDNDSPIIQRKIIMQYLNDGLPPPKYMKSWKMRPSLLFEVFK